jgi:hypothetical protein
VKFAVGTVSGGARSGVAWGSVSQCYFVTYTTFGNIYGQRISGTGGRLGNEIFVSNLGWYPAVSYGPGADAFLVTWDYPPPSGPATIGGQRYAAATGALLGSFFTISPNSSDRSTITHDDGLGRWLVQYQDHSHPGQSYDQFVRFVNDDGALGPGPFPAADRPEFEGETNLGCDIAFSAGAGVYFSVYGSNDGIYGQLLDRNGSRLRARAALGLGDFTFHSNAADPVRDRFLTVFSGSPVAGNPWYVYSRLYYVYTPVSGLSATQEPGRIRLVWTQPSDMTDVFIRFSTAGTPASPGDGTLAAQLKVTPGTSASFVHTGIDHAQTYYYAVFAFDSRLQGYALGVAASARPALPGDMDGDGDVDQEDFGRFQTCLSGDGQGYPSGCASADLEGAGDNDVDPSDFEVFKACMGGPGAPPGC